MSGEKVNPLAIGYVVAACLVLFFWLRWLVSPGSSDEYQAIQTQQAGVEWGVTPSAVVTLPGWVVPATSASVMTATPASVVTVVEEKTDVGTPVEDMEEQTIKARCEPIIAQDGLYRNGVVCHREWEVVLTLTHAPGYNAGTELPPLVGR